MKTSTLIYGITSTIPLISAFPTRILEELQQQDPQLLAARTREFLAKRQAGADSATAVFEAVPVFDAESQFVDVGPGSGHEWQAPGPDDLRGECPGLNAFANHGFLPRSGVATITQFVDVTTKVVGMGPDLALFLAVLGGLLASGDLVHWSIGGSPTPSTPQSGGGLVQGTVGGVVGSVTGNRGNGLVNTHNKYENDVSPTRPDLYESGNNYITQATQFQDLINASPDGIVTINSLTSYRSQRFDHQIANNPQFFNAPFPGLLVQSAAFTFIYRFMANHTTTSPTGHLTHSTLQTWFGITGANGNYSSTPFGHERIPSNWYRRSHAAPYTIPYFLADTLSAATLHPKFLSVGGNLNNQTSNFAGVEISDLTGGVFKSEDLLEGNNLGCFAFQAVAQIRSDLLGVGDLVERLQSLVGGLVRQLGCPKLGRIEKGLLEQFPGYMRSPIY